MLHDFLLSVLGKQLPHSRVVLANKDVEQKLLTVL